MWLSDHQKFGAGFCAASAIFFLLGLTLFFDRACLSMANILFLIGITLLMGTRRTLAFFANKEKYRGTACFFLGIMLILAKWTIVGLLVELYGIFGLFKDVFGVVVGFIGSVPVVGPYLEGPLRKITGMCGVWMGGGRMLMGCRCGADVAGIRGWGEGGRVGDMVMMLMRCMNGGWFYRRISVSPGERQPSAHGRHHDHDIMSSPKRV